MSALGERAIPCDVVELRRYTLRPGARETLVELFDREFIETQEAVGIHLLGQFKDLDDPDVFVWLRGFRAMSVRAAALEAFYGGPVWKQHRDAANATMLDSDDVRLLRPEEPLSELIFDRSRRPPPGTRQVSSAVVTVTICSWTAGNAAEFPEFFATELAPKLRADGVHTVAALSTEHSPNNFPVLPIREGEELFVWVCHFPDAVAQRPLTSPDVEAYEDRHDLRQPSCRLDEWCRPQDCPTGGSG